MSDHRHNIYMPDELWSRVRQAAANESAEKGRTVSVSEWLRDVVRERLDDSRHMEAGDGE